MTLSNISSPCSAEIRTHASPFARKANCLVLRLGMTAKKSRDRCGIALVTQSAKTAEVVGVLFI